MLRLNALQEESERLRLQRASLASALLGVEGTPLGIPFLQHLGVESVRYTPGDAIVRLVVVDYLENSFQMVHGGVTMTLLDVGMAMAARSVLNSHLEVSAASETHGVVTVEMKASFLAPGTGTMLARGRCLQRGASLLFCEGEVFGANGGLIATSSGTFKAIRRREVHAPHAV
ncbi:MAG: PaaI family thioesterase [Betaproteobacteria bacterium]